MKRTRKRYIHVLFCIAICLALAACGQRGPLYLPDQNEAPETTGEGASADPAAEQDGEENDDAESGF